MSFEIKCEEIAWIYIQGGLKNWTSFKSL